MVSPDCITILVHEWVTGGGLSGKDIRPSWFAEGRAIRRSIVADFAAVRNPHVRVMMTLDERWPEEAGPWTSIPIRRGDAPDRVVELSRHADYTVLIAPETTGVLAGMARALRDAGSHSLGSLPDAIELTADKHRLAAWLSDRGLPTPPGRVVVPTEGLPTDVPYPAVLKPIDGAGSVDTYLIADARSLPAAALAMPQGLLQPLLSSVPMSACFLVDKTGEAALVGTGRQKVVMEEGRFTYLGGRIPASCPVGEQVAREAVHSVPGLQGFVGVDFIWEPSRGEAMVLEINPRPTTSHVGISRLLEPGTLARAWLAACGVPGFSGECLNGLADAVARQPAIEFDCVGNVRSGHEDSLVS
jgi:predicted ATP-grasp superfamily ATP-dependent carboligase